MRRGAIVLVLLALGALLGPAAATYAQPNDPQGVVNALFAAENANNPEAAAALFAPEAVVTLPTGVLRGTAEIRGWQDELAAGSFHANVGPLEVDGNTVRTAGNVELDLFRNLGLPIMESTWEILVQGGRITMFTFNFTPEAGAKFQAALAGATEPTPEEEQMP